MTETPRTFRRTPMVARPTTAAPQTAPAAPGDAGGKGDEGPFLLVLDAETRPDRSAAPEGDDALKPMFHAVAALAFLRCRILQDGGEEWYEALECRAGGKPRTSEADLLSGFWKSFEAWKPRLVTFNGRGFVLPVLKYRSMRQMMTARYLHEAGDKWSGYGHRYSLTHHIDMMDVLSDHHASTFPSLPEVAAALDIPLPAKSGDTEAAQGEAGIEAARAAAESDVVAIYLAYLRWRLFTGKITREGHAKSVASLRRCLESSSKGRPHLAAAASGLKE
jgi:hypothetical protein